MKKGASLALCLCAAAAAAPSVPVPLLAQATSVYVEDLTWPEVRSAIAAGKTTAIIYAGSTEQNGPHMAVGKHNFLARYIAGAIAIKLRNALVYPTLPFAITGDPAKKTGHMAFPGSVSLAPGTFRAVLRDIALSASAAGFHNVVLMGDHGEGQHIIGDVARELDARLRGAGTRVFYIPDVYFKAKAQARAYEAARGIRNDVHAGTDDTSELMAIDAQHRWIRADKLAPSDADRRLVTGAEGDPTKATAAMGRIFIGYKVDDAASQIRALSSGR